MGHHTFRLRLSDSLAGTSGSEPALATGNPLLLERLSDTGVWEQQDASLSTPPFRLYLFSLLLCMRFHLVREANAQGIPLHQLQATFTAEASEHWDLERLSVAVQMTLDPAASAEASARADVPALAAIRERMERCPVVRNLPATTACHIHLALAS